MFRSRILLYALLGLLPAVASARQKVGLALGGGSARGMAHVGVLEWMEEHRIPIDAITGTSMGGLIAGTYATGLSGEEIRELLAQVDWDTMFRGEAPHELLSFRRKQDARLFPAKIGFGLKGGFSLPSGIDPGHQVDLLLSRITLPYSGVGSFDDLPTPLRTTATDMNTASLVVFKDGSLAQAMRATMSLPGVFPPVKRQGQVLVDGGVLDNVPADIVREMGVDYVIAVDVGFQPGASKPSESSFGLLSQTTDIWMYTLTKEKLKFADLVLRPDLRKFGSLDWRKSGLLADQGYKAAEAHKPKLLPLALDEAAWKEHQAARQSRVRTAPLLPTSLVLAGVLPEQERALIEKRMTRHIGAPLDRMLLEQDLVELTGTDRYDSVAYSLVPGPNGDQLILDVRSKAHAPPFVDLALDIDNTATSDFRFALRGRMTSFDVLGFGSELRLDVGIGTPLGVAAELYRPIGNSPVFIATRLGYVRTLEPVFGEEKDVLLGESQIRRAGGGVDLGVTIGSKAELRLGYGLDYVDTNVYVGSPTLPSLDGWEQVARLRFEYDGQDSAIVPSRGIRFRNQLRYVIDGPEPSDPNEAALVSESPTLEQFSFSFFHPVKKPHRMFFAVEGATAFDSNPINLYRFTLGGPNRLSAFRLGEVGGKNTIVGSLGYLRHIGRLPDFVGGPVYLGGWTDVGSAFDDVDDAEVELHFAGSIVAETLLGPLTVGGAISIDGDTRIFASLGALLR